jgi:hypothetical protein
MQITVQLPGHLIQHLNPGESAARAVPLQENSVAIIRGIGKGAFFLIG